MQISSAHKVRCQLLYLFMVSKKHSGSPSHPVDPGQRLKERPTHSRRAATITHPADVSSTPTQSLEVSSTQACQLILLGSALLPHSCIELYGVNKSVRQCHDTICAERQEKLERQGTRTHLKSLWPRISISPGCDQHFLPSLQRN